MAVYTYLGHGSLTLEPPADPVINTLWFPPVLLDALVAVRLVTPGTILINEGGPGIHALEARRAFLDDFNGGRHRFLWYIVNDQVIFTRGPSDGCEAHPAIPSAKPPTYWYQ